MTDRPTEDVDLTELGTATKRRVTARMVAAGVAALTRHDYRVEGPERAVARVFLAMARKQRQ